MGEIALIIARLGGFQIFTAHPSPLMEASRQPQTHSVWSLTEPNQNQSVLLSPALHHVCEFRRLDLVLWSTSFRPYVRVDFQFPFAEKHEKSSKDLMVGLKLSGFPA